MDTLNGVYVHSIMYVYVGIIVIIVIILVSMFKKPGCPFFIFSVPLALLCRRHHRYCCCCYCSMVCACVGVWVVATRLASPFVPSSHNGNCLHSSSFYVHHAMYHNNMYICWCVLYMSTIREGRLVRTPIHTLYTFIVH